MYYTPPSIFIPKNACIHFAVMINTFIFEEKDPLVSLKSKINSFLRPIDAFHLCKLISRIADLFTYLNPIAPIRVPGKLFKTVLFSTKIKYDNNFLYFKSVSVR